MVSHNVGRPRGADPSFLCISGCFFSGSVAAHVTFSLSLTRIWLSRSTSKTDALDDDETPLRFTAPQTATTRGVMVSDIMTLHRRCTNCAALVEPGRKFLVILDNSPSHASRLACEHQKTVFHGTVEFQPPCSPDLSPLHFCGTSSIHSLFST